MLALPQYDHSLETQNNNSNHSKYPRFKQALRHLATGAVYIILALINILSAIGQIFCKILKYLNEDPFLNPSLLEMETFDGERTAQDMRDEDADVESGHDPRPGRWVVDEWWPRYRRGYRLGEGDDGVFGE